METSSPSPIFPRFSHLPAELRLQIWRDVLPERDVPALFSYKKRCWRILKSGDDEYTAMHQNPDLNYGRQKKFRPHLLDPVQVRIPLASVNHEARLISIYWAKKHEIEYRFCPKQQCHIFVRYFDPTRDTLYFSLNNIAEITNEAFNHSPPVNIFTSEYGVPIELPRFAIPESVFRPNFRSNGHHEFENGVVDFFHLLTLFTSLNEIVVTIDPQPGFGDKELGVQRRWEVRGTQEPVFCEDIPNSGFTLYGNEDKGHETLYQQIREAAAHMAEAVNAVSGELSCSVNVRVVFAVKN